ncbi:MAG: type II secretion system F family protein, partial [Clostridia bacterium]|nr:type II secretion system F family protein [Clostridia bacterium]
FISSSMSAGGTVEGSFYEYAKGGIYGTDIDCSLIKKEFEIIVRRMDLGESVTSAFSKFAERSASSDIKIFSLALCEMSSAGGNVSELIKNASSALRLKKEMADEIRVILASPEYNHYVITVMPCIIVYLMKLISPEYIASIYTGEGRIVAVVSSVMIAVAWFLGKSISNIKV